MTGADHRVGLVVVTYSPGDTLAALLDSVPAAGGRPPSSGGIPVGDAIPAGDAVPAGEAPVGDGGGGPPVVIADNGSTDGSVEAAAGRPGVTLLRTGGNVGYGAAANAGSAALPAAVDLVLLVNPDVVLGAGAIDELIAAVDRHPRAGAFGPLITAEDGTVYPSARRLPSIGAGIGHAAFGWWWPANPWTRAYRVDGAAPVERPAGWLSGACLLLRRSAFEQVGGFDPGFFMYFEDVDLGERLGAAGWQNIYVPAAQVIHLGGRSTAKAPDAMAAAHHRSAYRYLALRYDRWWQLPLRLVLKGGLSARAALAKRSPQVSGGAALPDRKVAPPA